MNKGLGRRVPTDWTHVDKYPVKLARQAPYLVPVTFGINWYASFNVPDKVGDTYWIGNKKDWGRWEGGHAICLKPESVSDTINWYVFYDQGNEGSCVGFACARMMSLLNRKKYSGRAIYKAAQWIDEWDDTPPGEGTSVRAGCDILRTKGARIVSLLGTSEWKLSHGILENRWATSWDEVRAALGVSPLHDGVPFLNSWGWAYPRKTRLTDEAGERLLLEQGEAAIVTDRV